ncbi:MAG TPA: hypothetical protein DCZ49_04110 [Hyphomonadaceae bacterium]|nr:hypothetical protein [Hyphomonadaceae bacterium]
MSAEPQVSAKAQAARGRRNWALAVALLGFVAVIFAITMVRLQENIRTRAALDKAQSAASASPAP